MYRTAYVELKGTHEILSLSKTADEKVFTYKNVDFFPHAVMSTLTEILNMRYELSLIHIYRQHSHSLHLQEP